MGLPQQVKKRAQEKEKDFFFIQRDWSTDFSSASGHSLYMYETGAEAENDGERSVFTRIEDTGNE